MVILLEVEKKTLEILESVPFAKAVENVRGWYFISFSFKGL